MLVVIRGCQITTLNTCQSVTDRHIGAIINIWIYIYIYQNTYKCGGFSYDLKYIYKVQGHTKT